MFGTFKQRLLVGIYIFILLSIPVGALLASQYQTIKSSASEKKVTKPLVQVTPKPATSSAKQLLSSSLNQKSTPTTFSPAPSETSTLPTSYGPTLSLKVNLEGRAKGNQATKLFVGIAEGTLTINPKFLLSFTVNLPASGIYSGLSLAGLNPGSTYTALLKGSAQIASAVTFTMSPAVSNLNDGQAINLTSGDLNDDNVVNNTDYAIMQKALGAILASPNWNENADLNKDDIINAFDMTILIKNIGQVGVSGAWTSPIPKVSTPSASLTSPFIGSPSNQEGYWLWLPN